MSKEIHILLLLWHPQDAIAGGFVRVKEILPYLSKGKKIKILDNYPSLVQSKIYNVRIVEYKIPKLIKLSYNIHFALGRFLEWLYAALSLINLGIKELKKGNYNVIYGPTGDNPHIFVAGVILKKLFPNQKLLLDVLNLEMPEGGARNYFKNFRNNNVGFFESIIRTYPLALIIFLEQKLIKACDFVVTVSPYMKSIISRYYPEEKIDFTPSGVSIPKGLRPRWNKKINGVYFGRHTKDKGIFDVIKVWEKVSRKLPNAKLVTAGSIQDRIRDLLARQIVQKGLGDKVKIRGAVSEEEKWNLLSQSKYFLHLAYFEPLVPVITILEALACGLPVIMYDIKAIDDYTFLRKSPAIFIVKNQNIEEVVKTVLHLESLSTVETKKIALEARKLAKKFSWKEIAEKELYIIQSL